MQEYNIIFHCLWDVTRDIRKKHKLTLMNIAVMNAMYVYLTMTKKKEVAKTTLQLFIGFLNKKNTLYHINKCIEKGMMTSRETKRTTYYTLTHTAKLLLSRMRPDHDNTMEKLFDKYATKQGIEYINRLRRRHYGNHKR